MANEMTTNHRTLVCFPISKGLFDYPELPNLNLSLSPLGDADAIVQLFYAETVVR